LQKTYKKQTCRSGARENPPQCGLYGRCDTDAGANEE